MTLDGRNKCFIYDKFPSESLIRINFAYNDLLSGHKSKTYLTFFDFQAIPYTRRIGGEFYSGLYDFVKHLHQIYDNYDEFETNRENGYAKELNRWNKRFKGEFNDWNPYTPIIKKDLQQRIHQFERFKNSYEELLEKHEYGIIYVRELSTEKIVSSNDVPAASISVNNVFPEEIIDSIKVTTEMEENFKHLSCSIILDNKTKYLNTIRDVGTDVVNRTLENVKSELNNYLDDN